MVGDWIKLHRKSLDSAVFSDPWLWHLWSWCLLKANYKDGFFQTEPVKRGQFVTGRESGAKALRVSEAKWYRGMKKLESIGNITLKSNNRFTIVTICNYETYQLADMADRTTGEQQANNGRTTGEQQANTIEERKELKEKKEGKENPQTPKGDYSLEFEEFWKVFPKGRKQKKGDAWTAWKKAMKTASAAALIEAAKEYADSPKGRGAYVSGPTPWLNGRCWEDDREAWQDRNGTAAKSNGKHETYEEWEKRAEKIWAEQDAKKGNEA